MKINRCLPIRFALILLTMLSLFSCSKDQDLSNLDETLFVRHKDADMPAYIHGNGSEKVFVILLHGGPGDFGLVYRGTTIKSEIEKAYAMVYFDQRGSGMSQGSYSEDGINVDIMAEDVLALIKVMKRKYGNDSRFFLMGHSWGGTLGTAALLKDQSDFKGWIEVDGAHDLAAMYEEYQETFERVANEQIELENSVPYWEGVLDFVNEVAPSYNQNDFLELNNEAFEAEGRLIHDGFIFDPEPESNIDIVLQYNLLTAIWNSGNIAQILVDEQDIFNNISYTERLHEITIPSLIMSGRYDMIVPLSFAEEAYENLGSSTKRLVIFENSGHGPMISEADLFADEVLQFIDQNK